MGIESQLRELGSTLMDKLGEQEWFQQLRSKWEELDSKSKTYVRIGGVGGGILLVLIIVVSAIANVHSLKSELNEKQELIQLIQQAGDELNRLRQSTPSAAQGGGPGEQNADPWPAYFESRAAQLGIDKAAVNVSSEKPVEAGGKTASPGATDNAKESIFEIGLKKVNIKQAVRYAFALENGARPVKLRNLSIDTRGENTGYLDVSLQVSAFRLKE